MFALSADINAFTTFITLPPAKKCVSKSSLLIPKPAFVEFIIALTITPGGTFLHRIRTSCNNEILTPESNAENHIPTGIK